MPTAHRPSTAALGTPTDLSPEAAKAVTAALNPLLADAFALYLKTKNFHWHVSGPHFRDYHLLLDDQGEQIVAMTDVLAERLRKLTALRCDRSDKSPDCSASRTTRRSLFQLSACSAS
jgi:starvation-inducible DNA-binding protein